MKIYTLKEVEDFGLLDDLEEDRKQYITNVFNFVLSWFLKNGYISDKDGVFDVSEFSFCALPSILRTSRNININENEINEILEKCYVEFNKYPFKKFNKYPFKELYLESNLMLDVESEFMCSFSNKMIEQYKK